MISNEKTPLKRVSINYLPTEHMFGKSFLHKGTIYHLLVAINIGHLSTYSKDPTEMNEKKKHTHRKKHVSLHKEIYFVL